MEVLIAMLIVGAIGCVLGFILSIASKVFEVFVDPRIDAVQNLLPGYNCGACGFPGCNGMATALVNKDTDDVKRCRPSNPEQRASIVEYLKNTPGPDGGTLDVKG